MSKNILNKRINGVKIILSIIITFAIMLVSQLIGLGLGELLIGIGIPAFICNIISSILYLGCTMLFLYLYVKYILGSTLTHLKVGRFRLSAVWILIGTAMPIIVTLIYYFLVPNELIIQEHSLYDNLSVITRAVFLVGIATGIVEEVLFRGLIMTVLEEKWNKVVAIIVPSVIFGAAHIIGNNLDFFSVIQLMIAGTAIGIVFSLITYETGSIWCSAYIHAIWNIVIIGGIFVIGAIPNENHIMSVVLQSNSFLLTGGDFGIEASMISLIIYLIVIGVSLLLLNKRSKKIRSNEYR